MTKYNLDNIVNHNRKPTFLICLNLTIVASFLVIQCNKENKEKVTLPEIYTVKLSFVTEISAKCAGNVFSDGGSEVTSRGICWDIFPAPTIDDNKSEYGMGKGYFICNLTGLNKNTTYRVRAYATNKIGTAYGDEKSFKTQEGSAGTITDADGNLYQTIIIGTQIWIAENLKTTKLNDGTDIPYIRDDVEWVNLDSSAYCWYNNDIGNKNDYGALYNWFAVETGKLCPEGWHVPSEQEVIKLIDYYGIFVAGTKLRESGAEHWESGPVPPWSLCESTNESGFTARGGGSRDGEFGNFSILKATGNWWTSSISEDGTMLISLWIDECSDDVSYPTTRFPKKNGLSVRCLKD